MCVWALWMLLPQYNTFILIRKLTRLCITIWFRAKTNWGPIVLMVVPTTQGYCQIKQREMLWLPPVRRLGKAERRELRKEEWMLATELASKQGFSRTKQRRWNLAQYWCAYSEDMLTSPFEAELLLKQKATDTDWNLQWCMTSLAVISFNYSLTTALKRGADWELDCDGGSSQDDHVERWKKRWSKCLSSWEGTSVCYRNRLR